MGNKDGFSYCFEREYIFEADSSNSNYDLAQSALVEKVDFVSSSNNTVIYFETEDNIAEEQRIDKAGGKVVQPKMNIGEFGYISIFIDTEGNTVGLHSRK